MEIGTSETIYAAAAAAVSGAVLKLIDVWVKRTDKKRGEAEKLREQYRRDAKDSDARADRLAKEVDDWREKYYSTFIQVGNLENQLKLVQGQLELLRQAQNLLKTSEKTITISPAPPMPAEKNA